MTTRRELIQAIAGRYRSAVRSEKKKILDEFIKVTGFHRKHAIRALKPTSGNCSVAPPRSCIYDEAVTGALTIIWEAADRICGKRLKEAIPTFVAAMERHGHLQLECEVRRRLLEEYGIEIGGGLGVMAGKAWRIGLMGHGASVRNVDLLLAALGHILH